MSDESPATIAPLLDDHDLAAVFGLFVRVIRIDNANTRDKAAIAELTKALAARALERQKYVTGIAAFGFDTSAADLWAKVKIAIGDEANARAFNVARSPVVFKLAESAALDVESEEGPEEAELEVPKVRDAILNFLRARPNGEGAQVPAIKDYLTEAFKMVLHEKTPGMTLYRLSKEELVRREGRTWFATDKTEENMQTAASGEAAAA